MTAPLESLREESLPPNLRNYQVDLSCLPANAATLASDAANEYQSRTAFGFVLPTEASTARSFREKERPRMAAAARWGRWYAQIRSPWTALETALRRRCSTLRRHRGKERRLARGFRGPTNSERPQSGVRRCLGGRKRCRMPSAAPQFGTIIPLSNLLTRGQVQSSCGHVARYAARLPACSSLSSNCRRNSRSVYSD